MLEWKGECLDRKLYLTNPGKPQLMFGMRSPTSFQLSEPRGTPWTDCDRSREGEGEGGLTRVPAGAGKGNTTRWRIRDRNILDKYSLCIIFRTCIIMNSAKDFSLTSNELTQSVRKEKCCTL